MKLLPIAIVLGLAAAAPSLGADLIVEKVVEPNGNTELAIVNRAASPVSIYKVVVNDRPDEMCTLLPVKSDYGTSLRRGDLFSNPALVRFDDQHQVAEVVLPLGGEVSAGAHRDCGRVLLVFIYTSDGDEVWEFRN